MNPDCTSHDFENFVKLYNCLSSGSDMKSFDKVLGDTGNSEFVIYNWLSEF